MLISWSLNQAVENQPQHPSICPKLRRQLALLFPLDKCWSSFILIKEKLFCVLPAGANANTLNLCDVVGKISFSPFPLDSAAHNSQNLTAHFSWGVSGWIVIAAKKKEKKEARCSELDLFVCRKPKLQLQKTKGQKNRMVNFLWVTNTRGTDYCALRITNDTSSYHFIYWIISTKLD